MNQQERDELRENHRRDGVLGCWTCQDYAWNDEYPCDVIRVLDAWADTTEYPPEGQNVESEVHDGSEVSTTREVCDHADWTSNAYSDGIYVDMGYRYCPKCGEKL